MQSKPKIIINVLMTAGMFLSMGLHCFGTGIHKMTGLLTILLFLAHNILNRRWYRSLFSGPYRPCRVAQTLVGLVLILAAFGMMTGGVMLSVEMAGGAPTDSMTTGRLLHLISSYTGCVAVAVHIGFHLKRRG